MLIKRRKKMKQRLLLMMAIFWASLSVSSLIYAQETKTIQFSYQRITYPLYPSTLDTCPDIPSPLTTDESMEIVIGFRKVDNTFTLIPVTVENGETLNYKKNQWGKGQQLKVDKENFPTLAETGLHSDTELNHTTTITGRTLEKINENSRPKRASYAGFMSQDEDIISVLKSDNRMVKKLGLIHPELAKPLFHLWNIIQKHDEQMRKLGKPLQGIDWFYYNGRKIHLLDAGSGHGWQESIFNDGILGMWQFEITKELDPNEKNFLNDKYSHLDAKQMNELQKKLSYIHTGEMVPFYIMRYGFYEGHTSYRADPIAISFIFGLRSIEEIENAFKGKL
ncbi:MAG: hypothetical protein K8R68_05855 [Bacteroidales bacterium]|nr:hypothetical protein [Bacteroidales bacterium]